MKKLRKAWALSRAEQLLLLKLFASFPIVRLGLKLPFRKVTSFLPKIQTLHSEGTHAVAGSADRLAYLVEVASRHHFLQPTCLEKALILSRILRKRGQEADLRIGTSTKNGKFEAHAWVELGGQVILGGPVEHYAPLLSAGAGNQLA